MNPSPTTTAPYPATGYTGTGLFVIHHCRLEIAPKTGVARVNAAKSLMQVVKRLADAAEAYDPIIFEDIKGNSFSPAHSPDMNTFLENFGVVNVTGKNQKVVMGFTVKAKTPFSTLKSRSDMTWWHNHGYFLRKHPMDFSHGLDIVLLGYWTQEHPRFFDSATLKNKANSNFQFAWDEYMEQAAEEEVADKVKEFNLQQWMNEEEFQFPIGLEQATVKYQFGGNRKDTSVIQLTVPRSVLTFAKFLLDRAIFHSKKWTTFLPFALSKDEPTLFGKCMEKHDDYLFTHRNLQIHNVDTYGAFVSTIGVPESLKQQLENNPAIYRVYPDLTNCRVHLSVTEETISSVIPWLDSILAGTRFKRYTGNYPSKSGSSTIGGNSISSGKYSAAFAWGNEVASVGETTIRSAKSSTPKSAWQRPTPITVICDLSSASFPPLAGNPKSLAPGTVANTVTTQAQSTVTFDEATLDRRLNDALAAMQAEQSQKLATLEAQFQKDLLALNDKLDATINTIIDKTIAGLSNPSSSPFATKEDHVTLNASVGRLQSTLDALVASFNRYDGPSLPDSENTSPPRKRSNNHNVCMDIDRPATSEEAAGDPE